MARKTKPKTAGAAEERYLEAFNSIAASLVKIERHLKAIAPKPKSEGGEKPTQTENLSELEIARRIAFALSKGEHNQASEEDRAAAEKIRRALQGS